MSDQPKRKSVMEAWLQSKRPCQNSSESDAELEVREASVAISNDENEPIPTSSTTSDVMEEVTIDDNGKTTAENKGKSAIHIDAVVL